MAILQISKIQQRSGNLVDLPQLDDAEFGWANDAKRLFIGKTTPNENIEILTSYSQISFSQLDGAVGNLNISNVTVANGQVLAYDGTDWVNKGGTAGGLITLGDVSNVKITGGAVGYVLETDGTGNLSWTPKGTLAANILNVSKADPAVVTTVTDNFFENGSQVTITNPQGMEELAGEIYYANVLTSNTFALYSTFSGNAFSNAVNTNSNSYTTYSYTTVSATTSSNNVTVADSTVFDLLQPVRFVGNMSTSGLENNVTYYIANLSVGSTAFKVATSPVGNVDANIVPLQTTSGLTAEVYAIEGQAIATLGSTVSFLVAGGADTQIQYNDTGALTGNSAFTYDYSNSILNLNGNANVSNLNSSSLVTASRFLSNVANGSAPLEVLSSTRVGNLNVAYANVSDFSVVTSQTTGTFYPVFVSSSASGNRALGANANISFNAATGNLSVTILNVTGNANVGNLGTAGLIAATGNVSGGNLTTGGVVTATGNVSGGNITTAGVVSATGNVSGGNLTTAGNVSSANVVATSYHIRSITTGITAAGSSQGTATALTKEINVVSTVSTGADGVVLPAAVAGMVLIVNNTSANTLNVYPATGAAINSGSTNTAYSHPSAASIQYYATSGTQWYTVGATFA